MKKIEKTRLSAKQKLENYKSCALLFIKKLRNPMTQIGFSVSGYEVTPTGKKPNTLSAPELLAIVGTAQRLGKNVQLSISGTDDQARINFQFVDNNLTFSIPVELL